MKRALRHWALESPSLLPGLLAVAGLVVLEAKGGGFQATTWYPGALFFLALLAVVLAGYRGAMRPPTWTAWAIVLLGVFTAWSYLSIAWADVKGDAWDGANRTLLYLTIFTLFAVLPWTPRAAGVLLGGFAIATAVLGVVFLVKTAHATDPTAYFVTNRFSRATGYPNANTALFMAPAFPAAYLASRAGVPILLRGVFLAAAGVLVDLAVLGQSRGWLFALPVVVALYVALVPGRVRSGIAIVTVALATWAVWHTLLEVYSQKGPAGLHQALQALARPLELQAGVLFVVGVLWAGFDRLVDVPEPVARWSARILGVVTAVVAAAAIAATLAYGGNQVDRVKRAWHQFTHLEQPNDTASSHFAAGLGSGRYDFWRVGLHELRASPVGGDGADNFAVEYLKRRKTDEEPLYPHSLEIRLLAGTGIVGTGLFAAFVGCALVGAWVRRRDRAAARSLTVGLATTAMVTFGYWFVHGSADWFWEFAGISAPAFAWLGLASRLGSPAAAAVPDQPRSFRRLAVAAGMTGAVAAAGVSCTLPWLSARGVDAAAATWRTNPQAAYDDLDQARKLNVLSDRPDVLAGAIAGRLRDWQRMQESFEAAVKRNPSNWYPHFELGVLAALQGKKRVAVAELAQVRTLNPREPLTETALQRLRDGHPLTIREVDAAFLERVEKRTGTRIVRGKA